MNGRLLIVLSKLFVVPFWCENITTKILPDMQQLDLGHAEDVFLLSGDPGISQVISIYSTVSCVYLNYRSAFIT